MKLGSDFWFWLRILYAVIKAILGVGPANKDNPASTGEQMFKSVMGKIVEDNEDDKHTAKDVTAL